MRIQPEENLFDPDAFSAEQAHAALCEGVQQFNCGQYHAAHESFEKCWLAAEGGDADFYKGLIQAAICLHHLAADNLDGARKLFAGHRKLLAAYVPHRRGLDIAAFLQEMQARLGPILRGAQSNAVNERPQLRYFVTD